MAIYIGKIPIASNGKTPYVSVETNNWVVNGEDTGVQAFPDTIDVDEYSQRFEDGTLDTTRKYNITGTTPRTVRDVVIKPEDWVGINPAIATVDIENIKPRDVVHTSIASSLDESQYSAQIATIMGAQIKRVNSKEGSIEIVTYGEIPTSDVILDLIIIKAIPGQ